MKTVHGTTSVICIIGNPIRHSRSPVMHNAAFAAGNLDYVYVPFAVSPKQLEQAVAGLRALGVCGFNVTIPHKTAIMPFLDFLDESAESAGAVNTVKVCEEGLIGYNTDGDGLIDALLTDLDFIPGTEQILVVGAGGAARGAIAALCRAGAEKVLICNRTPEKAHAIMCDMQKRYPDTNIEVIGQNKVNEECLAMTSLLLNTTSLGMKGERIEWLDLAHLPKHAKVYDMVYLNEGTPLVNTASSRGVCAVNGLGMLVAQGERAFEIWTGQKPAEGIMRKALNSL